MANFTNFNYQGEPSTSDFLVGYKSDGSAEQRTTINDVLSTGLSIKGIHFPSGGSVAIGPSPNNNVSNLSFAQGEDNNIVGFYGTAFGVQNNVTGTASMTQGVDNLASGDTSQALGTNNIAEGQASQAIGEYNVATNYASYAQGYRNLAGGYRTALQNFGNSSAKGRYNIAAIPYSQLEGFGNKAGYAVTYDWYAVNPPRLGFGFQNITSLDQLNIYNLNNKSLSSSVRLFFVDDTAINTFTAYVSAVSANYNDPLAGGSSFTLFLKNDENAILPGSDFFGGYIYCVPITAYDGSTSLNNIGAAGHAEGYGNIVAGSYAHAEGFGNVAAGYASHVGGVYSSTGASAIASHALGNFCNAIGIASVAMGNRATTLHNYSYIWNGKGDSSTFFTTASSQYCVHAPGGIYLSGGVVSMDKLPAYNNFQTNVMVKNANYASVSAEQLNDIGYFNSQGAFALPGSLIIKGHSPDYSTSIQNLPGLGVYGMYIQNVNNMDPGITFANDGRANSTHAFTFRGGNNNFTGGSDHFHAQWQGGPFNPTQSWQVTMGGDNTNSVNNVITNRFMVHTLPQYQISTTITATSGYIDTNQAAITNNNTILSGVKIVVSTQEANNWNLVNVGEVVGLQIVPGLAGLVAATYQSQVYAISSNYVNLSSFEFTVFLGINNNWTPSIKGVQPINLNSRANGGNPGVFQITSQIGSPASNYVGLTGNYKNVPKHILARFTNSNVLSGLKSGAPLTLWIPLNMASSLGTGFVTSSTESSPTNFRYGYFDAFVKSVSGTDLIMSIGNLMDTYGFQHRTWNSTVAGNAGWVLYGGSQDTVHRPTFGTTGFYFEREPWLFTSSNNFAYLSGGMVKNACLGNSESYGNYSYGLGFRGTILGDKSATLAGDMNYVYGNNSVALGGEGLVSLSGTQIVIGQYNDPNTNALFVAGSGASDIDRKNVYEISTRGDTKQTGFNIKSNACIAAAGGNQATATPITTDIVAITGGSGGGVILPVTSGGHHIAIQNNTGGTINVYSPVGGTIRNVGVPLGNPFVWTNDGMVQFFALSANTYGAY
jgi:hypothetical protein